MSKLDQQYKSAVDAVDALASSPGVSPGERATRLAELRNRISDQIVQLSTEAWNDLRTAASERGSA